MAYRNIEQPTVTNEDGPGQRGERRITHPAFATVRVSRVQSTGIHLFDSNISHDGYIVMSFQGASKFEDGYSERVMGLGQNIFEVAMTENQFVAMVTRMNVGSGVPVTIQHRQTGPLEVTPAIGGFENTSERLRRIATEIPAAVREQMDKRINDLKAMLVGLPKKKVEAIEAQLALIVQQSVSNLEYGQTVITEHAEKKITEAKVEIDAHVRGVVTQLGVTSLRELTQLGATAEAQKHLDHQP